MEDISEQAQAHIEIEENSSKEGNSIIELIDTSKKITTHIMDLDQNSLALPKGTQEEQYEAIINKAYESNFLPRSLIKVKNTFYNDLDYEIEEMKNDQEKWQEVKKKCIRSRIQYLSDPSTMRQRRNARRIIDLDRGTPGRKSHNF